MSAIHQEIAAARPRALVVDDSKLACFVLGRSLERLGFDVELAYSAEQGLADVARLRPAVVFMDHQMSGMSGMEAVRALRGSEASRDLPVVMYTSQAGDDFVAEAREAGANGVLAKHGERSRLSALLRELGLPCQGDESARPGIAAAAAGSASLRSNVGGATLHGVGRSSPAARSLVERLEPVLREQREQIRTELLAEFALLENGQESIRRQVLRRVDEQTHAMARRLERELLERDQDWLDARRGATRQRLALAASLLLPMAVLGAMVAALFGDVDRLQGSLDGLRSAMVAEATATRTATAAGTRLLQRTEQTASTLDRIEQRLTELPATLVTSGAVPVAFCLYPDGTGSYVLEGVQSGDRCASAAAIPGVQRVAALSAR